MNDVNREIEEQLEAIITQGGVATPPPPPEPNGQRALRRAMALNMVETARNHGGRDMFDSEDAEIVNVIQALLEKVAAKP